MHSPSVPRRSRRAAFTLLEILIVIALIALLVGAGIKGLVTGMNKGSVGVAEIFVRDSLKLPLTTYRLDMGTYPSTEQGLQALVTAPDGGQGRWKGPYAEVSGGKLPLDPWQQPYRYRFPGTHNPDKYDVWSAGPDLKDGTDDDIGNW